MAYKFPWTNYHELNLDWILETVKKLFAQTEQNNAIVEQYDGRLTEVELTADNAQTAAEQAQSDSAAALSLAQGAQTTATQAQQAAGQAQQAAGQAQTAAGQAQEAAATAQQTATQAQQTAQNFDGRITQAENNAANALQAAQAFDEQVQGAITAANNANEAATLALTTATETSRELAAQRSTLEGIVSDGVDSLQEAAQDATEEIEAAGQTVLDSIPADYTTLSELVDKKADVIYNTAAGEIASFNDGADDMKIKRLVVNIEHVQAGSGDPSPDNVRPISGHTGAEIEQRGKNLFDSDVLLQATGWTVSDGVYSGYNYELDRAFNFDNRGVPGLKFKENTRYTFAANFRGENAVLTVVGFAYTDGTRSESYWNDTTETRKAITSQANKTVEFMYLSYGSRNVVYLSNCQLDESSTATSYEPYTGNQISVNWEAEAGTVYNGTATYNGDGTWTIVADYAMVEYDGSSDEVWEILSNNRIRTLLPRPGKILTTCYSNYMKWIQTVVPDNLTAGSFMVGNYLNVYAPYGDTTVSAWTTYLTENNLQIVYPLANPLTYTVTTGELIKTLYQYNNIWSDSGSVDVEYPADTKTYIDNKFAELQALILEH